jgi:hypothetical protein
MQKIRVPINSFQYGEVSRSAMMRTDSPVYNASAQSLKNMVVMAEGSLIKRPGLKNHYRFNDITKDTSKVFQSYIVPFVFSDDEKYLISLENAKVRCFRITNGSLSLVSTLTADTNSNALPFDDDYLHQYTHAQYGDVMFICHPLFMPRMLIRTGLTSFEITPYTFDMRADDSQTYQPYSVFHRQNVTLDPSATTGTGITFTTSEAYFDTTGSVTGGNYLSSKHVGVVLRYGDTEIEITSVQSATQVTGDIVGTLRIRLEILNPLRTTDGSAVIEVTHIDHGFAGGESITVEGASAVGGINAAQINGARTVGTIINNNTYTITAGANANLAEDGGGLVKLVTHAPTDQWDEQSFSAVRGYPAAVAFHENRLVFGGTIQEPDTLWFSRIGQFFDFDFNNASDEDAFNLVAATGDVNEIRYMVSSRDLQIFTDASELYVPAFLNQVITPTNAQIRKQTPYGTIFVTPVPMDGATMFVQTGGNVVREYLYTDTEDAYTATSVSTIASHLLNDPIDMDVVHGAFEEAESYVAMVNKSGYLSVFGSNRAEKRAGWTKWESASGAFGTVAAVDDRLFATVWCGGYLKLCEFIGNVGLDSYISGAGPTISMTNIFENGSTVHIVGAATSTGRLDYLGTQVVASGSVSVSSFTGYSTFYVGIPFTIEIKTNPIDAVTRDGPMTGDVRGISAAIVDLKDTRSATVNGRPLVTTEPFTGKKEFRLNGYGRDPQITITQPYPLPIQVNGLIAELIV